MPRPTTLPATSAPADTGTAAVVMAPDALDVVAIDSEQMTMFAVIGALIICLLAAVLTAQLRRG